MQNIVVLGLNHKTAPVEIREKLSFPATEVEAVLPRLIELPSVCEAMFVSTCNRVEIYFVCEDVEASAADVRTFLAECHEIPVDLITSCLYVHHSHEAVQHVFRVASSLDSMVVGEPQILGQIKDAYRMAYERHTVGVVINRLLHKAFSVAKRVRTETGVASSAVSISFAAVELSRKIFGSLGGKVAMLVGAGEMAELAAQHLLSNGVERIVVANRTFERGLKLAEQFGGEAVRFEEMYEQLAEVDIVISSTGAPHIVITAAQVKAVMRRRRMRPIFFIDIAVPRDIDPDINEVSNAYVYDIDDLQNVVQTNISERRREALKAERIVEEEVIKFKGWLGLLEVAPTISSLNDKADAIRLREMKKTLAHLKDLPQEHAQAMDVLTRSIVHKLLHDPIICLKCGGPDRDTLIDAARRLFNLDAARGVAAIGPYEAEPEEEAVPAGKCVVGAKK
ncbi:MAG: glutamyl-tRNA reductase [Pseudomonadota bacterium]